MSIPITIIHEQPLKEAVFHQRPNRFLLQLILPDGTLVSAHLPDPGRLKELLQPGRRVWLRPAENPNRKTAWTAVLVEDATGEGLVSIDSTLPNRLIGEALVKNALEEFSGWTLVRPEFKKGGSRFDFLLQHQDGRKMLLEVKSVTLVRGDQGLFPDAITARGARHVRELTLIAQEDGWEAAVLFVLQRQDGKSVTAEREIDPDFARALKEAREAGVLIQGRRCFITLEQVTLGPRIPVK